MPQRSRPTRQQCICIPLLVLYLFNHCYDACFVAVAWNHPRLPSLSKWKRTTEGSPRAAVLVEKTLQLGLRGVLVARKMKTCQVHIDAVSNRQALVGKWQRFELEVHDVQGPLWHLDTLRCNATDVSFGKWPLFLSVVVPCLWWNLRRQSSIVYLFLVLWLWRGQRQSSDGALPMIPPALSRWLDGDPWKLNYRLVVSQSNLQQSRGWKFVLCAILRSLMLNSVVGEAAALGDALEDQTRRHRQQPPPSPMNLPLLGGTTSSQQQARTNAKLPTDSNKSSNDSNKQSLTQLLQATDFALQDVRIAAPPKNQLFLDAQASSGTTSFSYTLKVDLQSTRMPVARQLRRQQTALVLGPTAVRFQTSALLGNNHNHKNPWLQNILPDVYLPVGPGVAVLFPPSHQDITVRTIRLEEEEETAIELCGHRSFFVNAQNGGESSSSLVLRQ